MTTCERTPEPRTDPPQEPERREPTPEEVDACVEHVLREAEAGPKRLRLAIVLARQALTNDLGGYNISVGGVMDAVQILAEAQHQTSARQKVAAALIEATVDEMIHRATMPHARRPWKVIDSESTAWEIWEMCPGRPPGRRIEPRLVATFWNRTDAERIVADHNHPLGELRDLRDAVESALADMPTEEWP